MTENEERDLKTLQDAIKAEKISTYDYLRHVLRMGPDELKHSGYTGKTPEQATIAVYKASLARIENLTKKHVAKYPD